MRNRSAAKEAASTPPEPGRTSSVTEEEAEAEAEAEGGAPLLAPADACRCRASTPGHAHPRHQRPPAGAPRLSSRAQAGVAATMLQEGQAFDRRESQKQSKCEKRKRERGGAGGGRLGANLATFPLSPSNPTLHAASLHAARPRPPLKSSKTADWYVI